MSYHLIPEYSEFKKRPLHKYNFGFDVQLSVKSFVVLQFHLFPSLFLAATSAPIWIRSVLSESRV